MKWFRKEITLPPLEVPSAQYTYRISHDLGFPKQRKVEYCSGEFFSSRRLALEAAEEHLQQMYTQGIRYYTKYFPSHRILSSEIFIYFDGKLVPHD